MRRKPDAWFGIEGAILAIFMILMTVMLGLLLLSGCRAPADTPGEALPLPPGISPTYTTARGLRVDLPSWVAPGQESPVGEALDAYIAATEEALEEPIPTQGVVVVLVEERRIPGSSFTGYYWARGYAVLGLPVLTLRIMALAWRRDWLGEPADDQPWPIAPHEWAHDRQARRGGPAAISHDWDAVEERAAALRPPVTIRR